MPKNNKGRNAFFFFMMEWKKREEAQGRTFPNGLKDVQADPHCNTAWQSLTKQQKGPYEAMAKKDKIDAQIPSESKKTSLGESIEQLEKMEKEQQKFISDMHEHIVSKITSAVSVDVLPQVKFCFIHVNWFFENIVNNVLEYFPAEYAVGVFSLENGIEEIDHAIISAPIPLGYRREALETSQNSHNIPPECSRGESDFLVIYQKLTKFLEPRKTARKYPPLYTTAHYKGAVQSFLGKLCEASDTDKEQFLVYEIESLCKHLMDEVYKNQEDRASTCNAVYADYIFTRYKYIYKRGNECVLHEYVDNGSEHCSKSVLNQWAWQMCDEFCKPLKIPVKPGVHCPKETLIETDDYCYKALAKSMMQLDIKREAPQVSLQSSVLSSTGVTEQHRIRVSERTYEDEIRRRTASKPVVVVDHSKLDGSLNVSTESIDEATNKPTDELDKKYVPNNLSEKRMRAPKPISYVAATMDDYVPKNDENNFPPIGGRGFLCKKKGETRKAPKGRGQGHVLDV